ncbi:MAG: hypothetical protein R2822_13860 [Spirosomataceae bacterium]
MTRSGIKRVFQRISLLLLGMNWVIGGLIGCTGMSGTQKTKALLLPIHPPKN